MHSSFVTDRRNCLQPKLILYMAKQNIQYNLAVANKEKHIMFV